MKRLVLLVLCCAVIQVLVPVAFAQQEKVYQLKESELTEQQKSKLQGTTPKDVHDWVGLGKEVGEAVNTSLSAVTTQANNFAQTPVGKLTAFVVVWKVLGQDAVHFFFGIVEFIVFVPLFFWSYRRMCMTRLMIKTTEGPFWNHKRTYEVVPYDTDGKDFTPRIGHALALVAFVGVFLLTIFAY